MKKIVDGKVYNTDTADRVAEYTAPGYPSDFSFYAESLYRTKNGRWFLAGEGHANTRYAARYGDMYGWGSGLIPLSENEAREWCETHSVDPDVIAEYFKVEEA